MATSYTTNTSLAKPATGDVGWGPIANGNMDALDGLQAIGALAVTFHEVPSASLNVKVSAGTFINSSGAYVSYAGTSSYAVAASSTKYLWLTDSGVLTTGTAWPGAGTKCVRLATVVSGASTITSIADGRVPFVSAG